MGAAGQGGVGRSYTAGRRQPYLIRKWPGSQWTLPLGPYTLTQLVVGVGTIVLLVKTHAVWAHFGPVNLVLAIGLPVVLTYATRRTRIEGRDPVRAALAAAMYLLQPSAGYLRGQAWRPPAPVVARSRGCVVAALPATTSVAPAAGASSRTTPSGPVSVSLAELLAAAGGQAGR